MKTKTRFTLLKVSMITTSILMGVVLTATNITSSNRIAISNQLKQPTFEVVKKEGSEGVEVDNQYFKSKYQNIAQLVKDGKALTEEIEAEGAVLLSNNGALPLKTAADKKVSLFGSASELVSFGGRGSSHTSNPLDPVDLHEGLTAAGISINDVLSKHYKDMAYDGRFKDWNGDTTVASIYEIAFNEVANASVLDTLPEYGTAIYVLSRNGGEGSDLKKTASVAEGASEKTRESAERHTLNLTTNEKSVLAGLASLKEQHKINKIIVLFNTTNQIQQADFLDEYKIDASIWAGHLGIQGAAAIGKLLTGEYVPSGHLPDTFYYKHSDNPTYDTYPTNEYANKGDFPEFEQPEWQPDFGGDKYGRYFVYDEGIYVGYRYSETRYTDKVNNRANVGDFNYSDVIYRPFGSGLSYTTFAYSDYEFSTSADKKSYVLSVKVTNTGTEYAGKDVVQAYIQKPYTDFDIERGIEKSAVELVGYAKTSKLAPGASEKVTITVDKEAVKTYDKNVDKTYIVTPGEYGLTLAEDSHAAANNFLAHNGKTKANGMTENGNADAVYSFNLDYDKESFSMSRATGNKITNLFDEFDINTYSGKDDEEKNIHNKATFISRSNWTKEIDNTLLLTRKMVDDLSRQYDATFIKDQQVETDKYPTYGPDVKNGIHPIQLIDLLKDDKGNPIPYDADVWDEFMDQLTFEETAELLRLGLRVTNGLPSIGKPKTTDSNGPTGLTDSYGSGDGLAKKNNDKNKSIAAPYYPSIPVLAATFNKDLAAKFGDMLGEDALWAGYNGLYGIGLNTHRSPFAGRQFEYWSEDPFLAGTMASEQVKMLQSHGCNAYIKHFALNDQETNRSNVHIWSNEQALREISLRSFEYAVIDGGAMNAMASFTRIGAQMVPGCRPLLTDFLRGECGMRGLVVTDMYGIGYQPHMLPSLIAAGCDIPDGELKASLFDQYKTGYPTLANQMREAAKRVCYSTLQSNAMNGLDSTTIIRAITPPWEKGVIALEVISIVLFSASAIWGAVELAFVIKKRHTK